MKEALNKLIDKLENALPHSDPLGFENLFRIQYGFNPKKVSVDYATRQLISRGFEEFFRGNGEIDLSDCWMQGYFNL